ncbi:uncharacterized protein A4U43_C09F7770 [Asparagus officinalis]|uniref:C2H2-type domain-containing protein n=1 Tax=Asparagus officinalis TaxID=4686 RepID=A0A5P1E9B5_ASPOF|nr:zinc finger protein STOP1 homolog [Asparagus officinalis]ONK58067.1 uncharacterized protein A4U43_C09F7770 [Asparagus officinalis]
MEHKLRPNFEASSGFKNLNQEQTFSQINPRNPCYNNLEFSNLNHSPNDEAKTPKTPALDWDPRAMLTNLSFLEQRIHQVQDIVRSIIGQEGQLSSQPTELAAQQQLVTADLTCIIIQLISTAGTLLPSIKNTLISSNPSLGQLGNVINSSPRLVVDPIIGNNYSSQRNEGSSSVGAKVSEYDELIKSLSDCGGEVNEQIHIEDHDVKDSEDGVDGENLPPGSYEVLQLEKEEILAPHTHFCSICGKGFKRDANLRMHMRGHGDEYKTPAALAKPIKELSSEPMPVKRYSCPFVGCKRNKDHKKFQPLKTILCVKNHYKRSHCDKSYTCSRCNSKKFSVIADLKTHEKHCGRDKWLCSCGTTFSRKDKLFGHVALFQGHTPAISMDEPKSSGPSDLGQSQETMNAIASMDYNNTSFIENSMDDINVLDIKGVDDERGYFSPMNFDSCNFGGFDDFARQFDGAESSFSFLPSGSGNFVPKNGEGR